ncbi:hypothetical protein KP509_24G019700 [Ceratopteris richardii]|uniref:Uncharacterized protein n=1 Tax=Ceratopteris richardii TaxID=49495 RepID=A0A8T2RT08_CERRI|nr:hypothetical protein KP509_24G019700 [Ceratopteris richardii]
MAKEVSPKVVTFYVKAEDNESSLASLQHELEFLREERDNERAKVEKLEESQARLGEVVAKCVEQLQVLENRSKELEANKSSREGLARSDNENVVLDLRTGLMIADCHNVAIKEDSPKYDDDLTQRVDRMEREIKKLQEMTGRYDDQAGKIVEEFHPELKRMKSAQAESNEKVRQVEKENARLSRKLGRLMNRKHDETRGQVEDPKVGKMEGELKAMLDRLDAFGTELEKMKNEFSKKVDDLDVENMSRIWEERSIREEVEKLTVRVEKRGDIPLGSEKRVREDKGMDQIWNQFRSIDSDLFQYQSDIEHNKQGLRDLATRLEALRSTTANGTFLCHLSGQVESLRGRGW